MKGTLSLLVTSPFLLWQIDALIPAYGKTRAAVALHILEHWCQTQGAQAQAYATRIRALRDTQRANTQKSMKGDSV